MAKLTFDHQQLKLISEGVEEIEQAIQGSFALESATIHVLSDNQKVVLQYDGREWKIEVDDGWSAPWAQDDEEMCGSRGPRIGSEGGPICKLVKHHTTPEHRPHPSDGWGDNISWRDL